MFMEIDHEIMFGHSLPSADSRRAVDGYCQKYVHKILVDHLDG